MKAPARSVNSVQHDLGPSALRVRLKLEDDATAAGVAVIEVAAACRCAVQISRLLEDQTGCGIRSVLAACEMMEHRLRPASVRIWCRLEDSATTGAPAAIIKVAASCRRAIQISRLVEDHSVAA